MPFAIAAGVGLTALKSNFIFQHSFIDVVGYIGMVSYFVLITYFAHTTLGKMLLRLQVITKDGDWTFINILYRETIGRFLSGILFVGYIAIIATEKNQGFHDMLSDTCVVYKDMINAARKTDLRPAMADGPVMEGEKLLASQSMVQKNEVSQSVIQESVATESEINE